MSRFPLRLTAVLLGLGFLAASADTADAQFRGRYPNTVNAQVHMNNFRAAVNPNFYIAPGLTLRQAAFNTAVMGRAASFVPPYALGYNPYPAVANYGPTYSTYTPSVYSPLLTTPSVYSAYSYNPYPYNPYLYSGYSMSNYVPGVTINPYLP